MIFVNEKNITRNVDRRQITYSGLKNGGMHKMSCSKKWNSKSSS